MDAEFVEFKIFNIHLPKKVDFVEFKESDKLNKFNKFNKFNIFEISHGSQKKKKKRGNRKNRKNEKNLFEKCDVGGGPKQAWNTLGMALFGLRNATPSKGCQLHVEIGHLLWRMGVEMVAPNNPSHDIGFFQEKSKKSKDLKNLKNHRDLRNVEFVEFLEFNKIYIFR